LEVCAEKISAEIFKKENLRNETWWMSAFYSFCIQSVVRKGLMILERQSTDAGHETFQAAEHFRLPARLFSAIFGGYDPLNQDLSAKPLSSAYEFSRIEDLKAAQTVLKQDLWPKKGLACSGDYLRYLFEAKEPAQDTENVEFVTEVAAADVAYLPEPYLPKVFDIQSYRQFRADWDLAKRNYTSHVVVIGHQHGWDSDIYTLTEDKWASLDTIWKKYSNIALESTLKNVQKTRESDVHDTGANYDIDFNAFFGSNEKQVQEESPASTLYASLRQNLNPFEVEESDGGTGIQEQAPRFAGDLYWPRWIRGQEGAKQEGWCGMCTPSRWLPLDGAFQDDKDFNHGVNAATGRPFDEPVQVRRMKIEPKILWGLCGTCGDWVELLGSKKGEMAWFVHSFGVSRCTSTTQIYLSTNHDCSVIHES
jgi:hypothetical protein